MNDDTINDLQTVAGHAEGTLLANRYRIVRQLGQGGMGSVWLAEDTQLDNKQFAVKMLPSILVSNKRAYRQLKLGSCCCYLTQDRVYYPCCF